MVQYAIHVTALLACLDQRRIGGRKRFRTRTERLREGRALADGVCNGADRVNERRILGLTGD